MKLELRTPVVDDDALNCWLRNHYRATFFDSRPITIDQHRAFVAQALADPTARLWSIYLDGEHIGQCGLADIQTGYAEFGRFMVKPEMCHTGWPVLAEIAALHFAFDMLAVLQVVCRSRTSNRPVVQLHERLGFALDGVNGEITRQVLTRFVFTHHTVEIERRLYAASCRD